MGLCGSTRCTQESFSTLFLWVWWPWIFMQDPSQKFAERFCAILANMWMVNISNWHKHLLCQIEVLNWRNLHISHGMHITSQKCRMNNKHCFSIVYDTLIVEIDACFSLNVSGAMGGCIFHNLYESSIFLHDVSSMIVHKVWNQRDWQWETKESNFNSCGHELRKNRLNINVQRRDS